MNTLLKSRIAAPLLALSLLGCASTTRADSAAPVHNPLVVFLVRHGEKVDASKDARLSAAGRKRAAELARTLRSSAIEHVHSSDFIRTRGTAAPTARLHKLNLEIYDHKDLAALVNKLRKTGGRHLVVGHSTTTPKLARMLGGQPGPPINEKGEYDRLYVITVGKDETASSVLLRFGKAYEPRTKE